MTEFVYDLCIVGAGVFGCAAARYASANPSLKICLIGLDEPEPHEIKHREIFSSHYDSGRIVKVLSNSPAYQKLSRVTINNFRRLEKLSGVKFYEPVGFMHIGKKGNRISRDLEDTSAAVGTPLLEMSDEDFNRKTYPFLKLKDDEYGLLDITGSGILNCRKMLQAQKIVVRQQGCHILVDEVTQVNHQEDYSFHTVTTAKHGKIRSKRVLFTTGAFTNTSNFEVLPQLETYVYREMATLVRIPESEVERLSTMPGMIHQRNEVDVGSYMLPPVQYPDGEYYLKIGSMHYDSGKGLQTTQAIKNWFMSQEIPGETEKMAELLFKILPGLKADALVRKICVTMETPTGFPYIDDITPTVTVAVAGNGWGACIAEEVARLAVCLSLTGRWDSEIPKSLFAIVPKED